MAEQTLPRQSAIIKTSSSSTSGKSQLSKRSPRGKVWQTLCGTFGEGGRDEVLFHLYTRNQKLKILPAFQLTTLAYILLSLVIDIALLALAPEDVTTHAYLRLAGKIFFLIIFFACVTVVNVLDDKNPLVTNIGWSLVLLCNLGVSFLDEVLRGSGTGSPLWVQLGIFVSFVVLPWRMWMVIAMNCVVVLTFSVAIAFAIDPTHTATLHGIFAEVLIFVGAILLGVLVFVFADGKQRHAFKESKKSHEISIQLNKEFREQERLLLSVLPKHIADEMMLDITNEDMENQFRKIYMSRHDNVSILFADIVGFTAISTGVTAAELVAILNQLFGGFDELATKYHQQRIKILGDCYYCVCGAMEERSDHAVLAIHMGLAMIENIRIVRADTQKNVHMRVGIHTGSVIGGVLGQKQWQFDVLGKEVTLANHMESGGIPEKVHISEATKVLLNGQFEVEEGHGGDRDDYLKIVQIHTYFVKNVIMPYPQGTQDEELKKQKRSTDRSASDVGIGSGSASNGTVLREALVDKKRSSLTMRDMDIVTTCFKDAATEKRYRMRTEGYSWVSLAALFIVALLTSGAKLCFVTLDTLSLWILVTAEVLLACMTIVSGSCMLNQHVMSIPAKVLKFRSLLESHYLARMTWAFSGICVVSLVDVVIVLQCERKGDDSSNSTSWLANQSGSCIPPYHFASAAELCLLSVTSQVHIEIIAKMVGVVLLSIAYGILYTVGVGDLFTNFDEQVHASPEYIPTSILLSVQLFFSSLTLLYLNRKMEEISRHLFLWMEEANMQTKRVAKLRGRNEALIYNLLPAHVAREFIGRDRASTVLYSHAYDESGVLFAACPNFNDFYNETSVNNEGLECLRFLNEVISDYDELLKKPKFWSITKIKTIGSTYMACSGMITSMNMNNNTSSDPVKKRWKHLEDLMQFALMLKQELKKINEQSFNNFILRIGINHGPIVAGVIGARKPAYDIWGNTVNVASRMESTGLGDSIQVVEETKNILEEFGYHFKQRGLVKVKGKGELMTYFLQGRDKKSVSIPLPHQVFWD